MPDSNDKAPSHAPEAAEPLTDTAARQKTAVLLDAGMLVHSESERTDAYDLLQPVYARNGGLAFTERLAAFNRNTYSSDELPSPSQSDLQAIQLGFDPFKEWKRQNIAQHDERVMTTFADHVIGYIGDAQANIDAARFVAKALRTFEYDQQIKEFGDSDMRVRRALAGITRMRETEDYATTLPARMSDINVDLTDFENEQVRERIQNAIGGRNVGEILQDLMELTAYETGRLEFWIDQAIGHPELPAEPGREAVKPRKGMVDLSEHPKLQKKIWSELLAIATNNHQLPKK